MANENSMSTGWLILYVLLVVGVAYAAIAFVGGF